MMKSSKILIKYSVANFFTSRKSSQNKIREFNDTFSGEQNVETPTLHGNFFEKEAKVEPKQQVNLSKSFSFAKKDQRPKTSERAPKQKHLSDIIESENERMSTKVG